MTRIAIALAQDFADWEPALLAAAARGYLGVEIVYATPDGRPVVSMGGLNVTPNTSYDALDPANIDALVIPGGLSWEKGTAVDLGGLVQRFREKGRLVAGICAAAARLQARAPLMTSPIPAIRSPLTRPIRPIAAKRSIATSRRRSAMAAS